jgi:hypothetical protein
LQNCIRKIYSVIDEKAFAANTVSAISEAIPSLVVTYDENNLYEGQKSKHFQYPYEVLTDKDLAFLHKCFLHEHPFLSYHMHRLSSIVGKAVKITDLVTNSQFRKLGIYNEIFKNGNIEYQMTTPLICNRSIIIDICYSRDKRDFSEDERLILNLLGPHLFQAYKNVKTYAKARQTLGDPDRLSENERYNLLKSLGLSFRETEVLYWIAQGKTNRDVAAILNISSGTVKIHLAHLPQFEN